MKEVIPHQLHSSEMTLHQNYLQEYMNDLSDTAEQWY